MKSTLYVICLLIMSTLAFAPLPTNSTNEYIATPKVFMPDKCLDTFTIELKEQKLIEKAEDYHNKYRANLEYLKSREPQMDSILNNRK